MRSPLLRSLLLLVVFSGAAGYELVHRTCLHDLANGDFWWHLSTGLTILETHAPPHTGIHSQAASSPWISASWLYELLVAIGYRIFALRVVLLLALVFRIALAAVVFCLAGGIRGRFWTAAVLSLLAQFILGSTQPLPVYCSILAFALELILVLRYRRTGDVRALYALPFLFLLWANLHVQFVYGIFFLLLFVVVTALEHWASNARLTWVPKPASSLRAVLSVAGLSLLATFITPFGWVPYRVFFAGLTSAANPYFPDRLALHFRAPQDYLLLLLTMAAFLSLGVRRSRDFLHLSLLVLCAIASFYSQADAWLVLLASIALLATGDANPQPSTFARPALFSALAAILVLSIAILVRFPRDPKPLLAELGQTYPVAAADYIRDHRLPQPLFNPFPWGGFLTWYLPDYPVAIDGRTDLYGDDYNIHYAKAMNADEHYSTFPPLNQASTLVLQKNSLMGTALSTVPGFKTAYSDDVAVVLEAKEPLP